MYGMQIAEDDKNPQFKERPKRFDWVVIGRLPLLCQIMTGQFGFDVTWKWGSVFVLEIYRHGARVFCADIPNWEMAEIEDVAEALVKTFQYTLSAETVAAIEADLSFTAHDDATSDGCVMCGNEYSSLNKQGYCSGCWTVWNS